jgi:hypothetical protein
MAQISYRANLSSATYPMTIAEGGRTVVVPQVDQNFDRRVDPSGAQKDAGIPQALYLENVVPTVSGYQAVGFIESAAQIYPASYITNCFELKAKETTSNARIIDINLYVFFDGTYKAGPLGQVNVVFSGAAFNQFAVFSFGVIAETCYFFASGVANKYLYTVTTDGVDLIFTNITATVTPLNFLDTFGINAICASNNYLVGVNKSTVYYSSTTTPTDFVSSLVTGAGSIAPNNANYTINFIKENTSGFVIYTDTNAISAEYTGNARYPWRFRLIANSGPVYRPNHQIFGDAITGVHYVIENDNQVKIYTPTEAKSVAPEVTEFLQKTRAQAVFNYANNTFTEQFLQTISPQIYRYLNRYLIISINGAYSALSAESNFTHAIIYDTLLERYGKLKVNHNFFFTLRNAFVSPVRDQLVFVDILEKTIHILHFDIYSSDALNSSYSYEPFISVFILGKLQFIRNQLLQLEEIEIEGPQNTAVVPDPNFSCVVLPTLDGRNFTSAVIPYKDYQQGGVTRYKLHNTAKNHSIVIKGAFNLNTIECTFLPSGHR